MITDEELDDLIGLTKQAEELGDYLAQTRVRKRVKNQKQGQDYHATGVAIPGYLWRVITDEAIAKNQSKAAVINYLIICGIRAHLGRFKPPSNNTIKKGVERRGEKW